MPPGRPKGSGNKPKTTDDANVSSSSSSSSTAPPAPKSPKLPKNATYFSEFDRSVDSGALARSKSHEFLEMLAPPPPAPAATEPVPAPVVAPAAEPPAPEPLTEEQRGFMSRLFSNLLPPSGEPPVPLNDVSFLPPPQAPEPPRPPPEPKMPRPSAPIKISEPADVAKRKALLDYKIRSWLRICPHLREYVSLPDQRSDLQAYEMALEQCKQRCMGVGMEQQVARNTLKMVCGLFESYALPQLQSLAAPQMLPMLNGRGFALDVAQAVDAKEQTELQMAVDCCAIDLADYFGGGGPWAMLAMGLWKTFSERSAYNNEQMLKRAAQEAVSGAAYAMPPNARDQYADL